MLVKFFIIIFITIIMCYQCLFQNLITTDARSRLSPLQTVKVMELIRWGLRASLIIGLVEHCNLHCHNTSMLSVVSRLSVVCTSAVSLRDSV